MNSFKQGFNYQAIGRVVIHDQATGEMVLDKENAIHPQNMALVIARALARDDNGYIFNLCFGNGGTWEVHKPLIFVSDVTGITYTVPVGFTTDFSSVPRVPFVFVIMGNCAHEAATLHDWLYSEKVESRAKADHILVEASIATGVPNWKAWAMYLAVRAFGSSRYGSK